MKTFKVLAFGNCGGESTDCTTSYGAWTQTLRLMTDTCDGNADVSFSCSNAPRGQESTCVDVIKEASFPQPFDVILDSAKLINQNLAKDTCDGDIETQYACTPQDREDNRVCEDTYLEINASTDNEVVPTPNCLAWGNNIGEGYIKTYGVEAFCKEYVGNYTHTECRGKVPGSDNLYYRCQMGYIQRRIQCGFKQNITKYKYRNIRCCGNE